MGKQDIRAGDLKFEGELTVLCRGRPIGRITHRDHNYHSGIPNWMIVGDPNVVFYSPTGAGIELAKRAKNQQAKG